MKRRSILFFATGFIAIDLLLSSLLFQPKKKIIFFGDSITQAGVGKEGYITKMDSIIQAKGKAENYELIGAGISGHRVEDLYKRLDKDVLSKNPDAVVIWIGVNDVWHGKFVTDSNKLMFSWYYSSILRQLKERNIKVILCTPGVVGEKKGQVNQLDAGLNECADSIRVIAKRFKCPLVDLREEFVKYDDKHNDANSENGILTADGVHLNRTGNLFVAERMWGVVRKVNENQDKTIKINPFNAICHSNIRICRTIKDRCMCNNNICRCNNGICRAIMRP